MADRASLSTVLFVDDDEYFLDSIQKWSRSAGIDIQPAKSSDEALKWLREGAVSVIVSDLRMPGGDGVELLEKAKEFDDSAALVLLTNFRPTAGETSRLHDIGASVHSKSDLAAFLDNFQRQIPAPEPAPKPVFAPVWPTRASSSLHTVFLSYGGPDEAVARAIYEGLTARGADVFFFPESAVPGRRLHRTMSDGIQHYDRVVLLCSKQSLDRAGVLNEIEQVLAKEAADGGSELLIPVALDDFVYATWTPARADLGRQVRNRVIADFRQLVPASEAFSKAIDRIVKALEKDDHKRSPRKP